MIKIKAYPTSDGKVFINESDAETHELAHILGVPDEDESVAKLLRAREVLAPIFKARRASKKSGGKSATKTKTAPAAPAASK